MDPLMFLHCTTCCKPAAPCACPGGSPWVGSLTGTVGIRAVMSSPVAISGGSAPPLAAITWASSLGTIGVVQWSVKNNWYSIGNARTPCPAPAFAGIAGWCNYIQAHVDQGNDWTASGTVGDLPDFCGGGVPIASARCPTTNGSRSSFSDTFTVNGITLRPNLQTGTTFSQIAASSVYNVLVGDDADPANVVFDVLAGVSYRCLAKWRHYPRGVSTSAPCDDLEDYDLLTYLAYSAVWFKGRRVVPKADLCGMASVTVDNEITPGWVPDSYYNIGPGTGPERSCPSIPDRGVWYVGSGGSFTFTLDNCGGGGGFASSMAAEPLFVASAPMPVAASPRDDAAALVASILAEANA